MSEGRNIQGCFVYNWYWIWQGDVHSRFVLSFLEMMHLNIFDSFGFLESPRVFEDLLRRVPLLFEDGGSSFARVHV